MGYPMTWERLVRRNRLTGDYSGQPGQDHGGALSSICGDMRRLETDARDDAHLEHYAQLAGVTPAQARTILDAFFGAPLTRPRAWYVTGNQYPCRCGGHEFDAQEKCLDCRTPMVRP